MFFRDPGGESGPHIFMRDVFGPRRIPGADAVLCFGPRLGAVAGLAEFVMAGLDPAIQARKFDELRPPPKRRS